MSEQQIRIKYTLHGNYTTLTSSQIVLVCRYCTVYCSVDIYCNKCISPPPNKTRCPIAISHRLIDISRVCIVQHIETTRFYTREEVALSSHGQSPLGNCGGNECSAVSYFEVFITVL